MNVIRGWAHESRDVGDSGGGHEKGWEMDG